MEMAAAEAAKAVTRIPGLILSQHTSILGFLLRVCQETIVVDQRRPQWEVGVRLHRDRKTFGEVHHHRPTRTATVRMGLHHLHKTSITVGLHHPHHPHPTVTTMGIMTVITEINLLIRVITVHLQTVGMAVVRTTGTADSRGMTGVACVHIAPWFVLCCILCSLSCFLRTHLASRICRICTTFAQQSCSVVCRR